MVEYSKKVCMHNVSAVTCALFVSVNMSTQLLGVVLWRVGCGLGCISRGP